MTTFNYKKWVTDYKQGKPLFEQTTGSYTGSYSTGSLTGSYTGSYTGSSSTGSNSTGSYAPCIQDQQANSSVTQNPQLGDVGINQNFINNMQGKPTVFYQTKLNTFSNNLVQLRLIEIFQFVFILINQLSIAIYIQKIIIFPRTNENNIKNKQILILKYIIK